MNEHIYLFLPSAYIVRPGPISQKFILLFIHSVSNLLNLELVKAQVSGSGSGVPLSQDIVASNAVAWLSNATLRCFSLAEKGHTQKILS